MNPDQPREQGFADVFGAALAATVGAYLDAAAPVTALLMLAGTALGLVISDYWHWGRAMGVMWREASLERFRRRVEWELDRPEEPAPE